MSLAASASLDNRRTSVRTAQLATNFEAVNRSSQTAINQVLSRKHREIVGGLLQWESHTLSFRGCSESRGTSVLLLYIL
jgi:hypothetical protein